MPLRRAVSSAPSQSKTDPRVAKTAKDCCFLVEKKEVRKASFEMFIARVFDVGRTLEGKPFTSFLGSSLCSPRRHPLPTGKPFTSFLGSGFAIENRSTEPQDAAKMTSYLRNRRKEPFLRTVSDLHFLLFLANFLDVKSDLPVLCAKIVENKGDELEGFQMMINCYAGLE